MVFCDGHWLKVKMAIFLWVFSQLYIPSQLPLLMWFTTAQYKHMIQYIFVLPLNHCMETAWAENGIYMYIRTFQRGSIIIPTWPHPIFLVNMQTFVCRVCHDRWSNTVLSNLWSISLDHNPSRRCTKLLIENCSTGEVRVNIYLHGIWVALQNLLSHLFFQTSSA